MGLRDAMRGVRDRITLQAFSTDEERKAAFAAMGGDGHGGNSSVGTGVGSPVGPAPRGTRAGRFVESGGISASGKAAKTTGIHVPSNRHPGKGGNGPKAKPVPFKTQVATRLGLTPQQLSQVTHAVSKKSPARLAAGVKLHARLATNATSAGHHALAAQHKQAAAIHKAALAAQHQHTRMLSARKKVAMGEKKLAAAQKKMDRIKPIRGYRPSLRSHISTARSRFHH